MKTVALYYIIYTMLYFAVGGGDRYWGVFNMLSILFPLSFFMYRLVNPRRISKEAQEWLRMAMVITLARALYTTAMPFAPIEWIYSTNKFFAIIIAIWILIKMIMSRRSHNGGLRLR